MEKLACPTCNSPIEEDLVESTGSAECPFCGADVSGLAFTRSPAAEVVTDSLAPLPPKSAIQIIEATPHRRVIYLPGGKARGIGAFALLWNGFMVVFTGFWFNAGGDKDAPLLVIIPFFGLFWIVGLGFLYWWIKAKFERTFLLLDRDRLAIQRILFGRKRMTETIFTDQSRAELVESYRQNERPVYRIEVQGTNRAAKFGTALSRQDKNWLIDCINEFLGNSGATTAISPVPKFCFQCGAELQFTQAERDTGKISCAQCGQSIPLDATATADSSSDKLSTSEMTQPELLQIDEQSSTRLRFQLPSFSERGLRLGVGIFCIAFALFWLGGMVSSFGVMLGGDQGIERWLFLIFEIPFLLGGIIPLAIGLFALFGKLTVQLTPEVLACKYHVGQLGYTRRLPTASIDRVVSRFRKVQNSRIRRTGTSGLGREFQVCLAMAGEKKM